MKLNNLCDNCKIRNNGLCEFNFYSNSLKYYKDKERTRINGNMIKCKYFVNKIPYKEDLKQKLNKFEKGLYKYDEMHRL